MTAGTVLALGAPPGHAQPAPGSPERQLEVIVEQFNAVREDLRHTTARLAELDAAMEPLRARIEAAQRHADEVASAMYRSGQISSVSALLTAGSPDTLMDQLSVLDHLNRTQSRHLTHLAHSRATAQRQQHELRELGARQRTQAADLAARKAVIEAEIQRLDRLRGRAYRGGADRQTRGALHDGYVPVFSPDAAGAAVRFAYSQIGKVYRYGAEGPNAFDCSGLTMAAWKAAGVTLPHNAARQHRTVTSISRSELRPGDLVFYYKDVSHVAMYIGDGRVIEAPQHGERVSMRPLDFAPIVGYGRP